MVCPHYLPALICWRCLSCTPLCQLQGLLAAPQTHEACSYLRDSASVTSAQKSLPSGQNDSPLPSFKPLLKRYLITVAVPDATQRERVAPPAYAPIYFTLLSIVPWHLSLTVCVCILKLYIITCTIIYYINAIYNCIVCCAYMYVFFSCPLKYECHKGRAFVLFLAIPPALRKALYVELNKCVE